MDLNVNIVVCVPRPVLDGDFNAHSAWNSIREFLGVTRCARPRQAAHEEIGSVQVARGHGERGDDGVRRGARCCPTRRLVGLPSHATTAAERGEPA